MSHDVVADALSKIMNAKKAKNKEVLISNYSKLLLNILEVAKKNGYIESYNINKNNKKLKIIIGKLNDCKAIKPRFEVRVREIEKYVRRYLPARDFGIIIISTSEGIMTHYDALTKNKGGSLIAYFF